MGSDVHISQRGGASEAPSVDVLMLAYNVAPFITEAVEGVLAQRTDFTVRLVIAEDSSTDATPAICERLAQEHQSRILYVPGERNIGIAARTVEGLRHCSARYVAVCDSDDVWTDPGKLARQVAFLEAHPDHGFSYTDVNIIDRQGAQVLEDGYDGIRADYANGHIFARLLRGNFVNNSTAVVRRDLLFALRPNACRDELIGDYVRWLQLSAQARTHFDPERTTAYRRGGVTGSTDLHARNRAKMLALLPGLLLEHAAARTPVTRADKAVLLRKTAGALVRSGTGLRMKASMLLLLLRYLPALAGSVPAVQGTGGEN